MSSIATMGTSVNTRLLSDGIQVAWPDATQAANAVPASSSAPATSVPSTANARVGRRRKADSAPVAAIQLTTMHHSAGCINRLPMPTCTSSPAENCQFASASQPSKLYDPHEASSTLTSSENANAPNARAGGRQNPATSGAS